MRKLATFPWIMTVLVLLAGCAGVDGEAGRLHDLFDREWDVRLREYPTFATSVGVHDHNGRLTDMAMEDLERRDGLWRGFLEELDGIDRDRLDEADRINADIFRAQLQDRVDGFRFGAYQIPLNADSGFHTGFARLPHNVPLATVADYENYVARMRAFPLLVDQQIALMRMGLGRGMTLPRVVLDGIEVGMEADRKSTRLNSSH